MPPDDTTSLTGKLPFHIPCPPSALRLPPLVYRLTPGVIRTASKPIPPPPLGARVPGDRIVRSPLFFLAPAIQQESLSTQESEFPERTQGSEGLAAGVLVPAKAAEMTEEDLYVTYEAQGHTDMLIEKTGEPFLAESFAEDEILEGLSPIQKIDVVPAENPSCIEIRFEGDAIRITELAELLRIKSYTILRDLIGLEIFAKGSDSITMDTANKISWRYGIVIVCENSLAVEENLDNFEKLEARRPECQ